jgi:hypothetical protein
MKYIYDEKIEEIFRALKKMKKSWKIDEKMQ